MAPCRCGVLADRDLDDYQAIDYQAVIGEAPR
jgi:hypothetical protein